jgi:hypothetical protein
MPNCKDPRLLRGEVHLNIAQADYDPGVFYPGFWQR